MNTQNLMIVDNGAISEAQAMVLAQSTPAELVRTRKGRGGKHFRYMSHTDVTKTLNRAFGWNWDFRVLQFQVVEGQECFVLGELTVKTERGAITKQSFGQQDFLKNRQGEVTTTVGDCLKGAQSDALRKAASLLGIAIDLYDSENGKTTRPARRGGNGNGNGNGQEATPTAFWKRAKELGIDRQRAQSIAQKHSNDWQSAIAALS